MSTKILVAFLTHCISGFPISIDPIRYPSCELSVVRPNPIYDQSSSYDQLNGILSDTLVYSNKVKVLYVWIITQTNTDMLQVEKSFHDTNNIQSKIFLAAKYHSYVSRKYQNNQKNKCSVTLTITSLIFFDFGSSSEFVNRELWGMWIQRGLQGTIGLYQHAPVHLLMSISGPGKLIVRSRNTMFASPFLTYEISVDTMGYITYILDICTGSCLLTQKQYF